MKTLVSLLVLGGIAVIIAQFVKSGSKGPKVISGIAGSVTQYISLLK